MFALQAMECRGSILLTAHLILDVAEGHAVSLCSFANFSTD